MAKHDAFLQEELAKILRPGEQVTGTAVIWEGPGVMMQALLLGGLLAWLMMKFAFVALTDQRVILIKAKMGFVGFKGGNQGVETFELSDIASAEVKGAANQRRIILNLRNGTTRTLRLNTIARFVSGQKEFPAAAQAAFGRLIAA